MDDVAQINAEEDNATCILPEIGEDVATPFMPEAGEENSSISLMHTTDKNDSLENISTEKEKSLLQESLQGNNKTPSSGSVDFSVFNALIAKEKSEALENAGKSDIDKENEKNDSPRLPSSLPHDFDKTTFSFDFSDAFDAFPSPIATSQDSRRKSSNRRSRASLPFHVQFAQALQEAVDVHCAEDVFDNCDMLSKNKEPAVDAILRDVVVVVSKKLCHSQTELHNLTTILGGDTRFMYDNSCTHFIHQGKTIDISKDYMEAKKNNKHLVSPHWLQACLDANTKVNEEEYPVTYNPRMSIEVTSEPPPTRSKARVKGNSSCSTDDTDNELKSKEKNDELEKPSSPKEKVDFQKKMEEMMKVSKAPRNERRTRRQASHNTSANKSENCNRKMKNRPSSQKNDSAQSSNSDPQVAKTSGVDCVNEQSQGGFITYDDPTGRLERERILEHLKRASPSQDIESLYYPVEKLGCAAKDVQGLQKKEKKTLEPPIIEIKNGDEDVHRNGEENGAKKSVSPYRPHISLPITNASAKPEVIDLLYDQEADDELKKIENAKKYKFLFSGMDAQEKIDYGATIEELGGVLYDVQYFNLQSTHLIVKAPSKNEKYLSALASGRWALHKSYLDASREANDFVNEADHEWGGQTSANELATAARWWRIELAEKRLLDPKAGAFLGWVVLLCIEPSKQARFKRILEAGSAKMISLRPPFDNVQGATHAFIGDRKQLAKNSVDLRVLHDAGIWILKPEYIADYLILQPKPPTFDYVLEEVNTFDELSGSRKRKASEVPPAKGKPIQKKMRR